MTKFGKVLAAFVVSWKVAQYLPAVCPQPCQDAKAAWLPSAPAQMVCFELKAEQKGGKFKTRTEAEAFKKTVPASTDMLKIFDVTLTEQPDAPGPQPAPKKGEVKK